MKHKKRQVLAASLVVALALAVAVNWYYNRTGPDTQSEDAGQAEVRGNLGDSLLVAGTTAPPEDDKTDAADDSAAAQESAVQTAANAARYFSDAKLRQTQARDEVKDEIETLMESDNLDDAMQQKLLSLLSSLDSRQKTQADCEALIQAKTGGSCVVVLSGETAQVVVEPGTVNETTALQIAEIMANNAKITSDRLTIIEAK